MSHHLFSSHACAHRKLSNVYCHTGSFALGKRARSHTTHKNTPKGSEGAGEFGWELHAAVAVRHSILPAAAVRPSISSNTRRRRSWQTFTNLYRPWQKLKDINRPFQAFRPWQTSTELNRPFDFMDKSHEIHSFETNSHFIPPGLKDLIIGDDRFCGHFCILLSKIGLRRRKSNLFDNFFGLFCSVHTTQFWYYFFDCATRAFSPDCSDSIPIGRFGRVFGRAPQSKNRIQNE